MRELLISCRWVQASAQAKESIRERELEDRLKDTQEALMVAKQHAVQVKSELETAIESAEESKRRGKALDEVCMLWTCIQAVYITKDHRELRIEREASEELKRERRPFTLIT